MQSFGLSSLEFWYLITSRNYALDNSKWVAVIDYAINKSTDEYSTKTCRKKEFSSRFQTMINDLGSAKLDLPVFIFNEENWLQITNYFVLSKHCMSTF